MKAPTCLAIGLLLAVAGCTVATRDAETTVTASTTTMNSATLDAIPVIADYSPTVSDVGGLMYLLLHPRVDVLAITLPGTGEAGCDLGIDVTLRLLTLLDRTEIPVACDPDIPGDAKTWPADFLRQSGNLLYLLPESTVAPAPVMAPDLIIEVLEASDRPVVIWAVAPLTNLARVVQRAPTIASQIDRIVVMGGAVDVPGNVFDSPAEWNIFIDSAAAASVFSSGIPITLVPLDATNDLPVPIWYPTALERSEQSPAIVHLSRLSRLFPITEGFWFFWDELAATVITEPGIVTTQPAFLDVVVGGSSDAQTARDPGGAEITLATGVPDANAFYREYIGILAGISAPVVRQPTAAEVRYATELDGGLSSVNDAVLALFTADDLDEAYDPVRAAALLQDLADAGRDAIAVMDRLTPPTAFESAHAAFLDEFTGIVEAIGAAAERTDDFESLGDLFAGIDGPYTDAGCMTLRIELALAGLESALPCAGPA